MISFRREFNKVLAKKCQLLNMEFLANILLKSLLKIFRMRVFGIVQYNS